MDSRIPNAGYYISSLKSDSSQDKSESVKKYFEQNWESLLGYKAEFRKPILFLGAGVSVDSNIKLWKECIRYISNEFIKSAKSTQKQYIIARSHIGDIIKFQDNISDDPEKLIDLSDFLKRKFLGLGKNNNYWENCLKNLFLHDEKGNNFIPNENHITISKLIPYVRGIITTNYDCLLEDVIKSNSKSFAELPNVYKYYEYERLEENINKNPEYFFILKLHGCINDSFNNLIIGREDYAKFNIKYGKIFEVIEKIYNNLNAAIISLGYSVNDRDFLNLLSYLNKKQRGINNVIVVPQEYEEFIKNDHNINDIWRNLYRDIYNAFTIPYPVSNTFSQRYINFKVILNSLLSYFEKSAHK